MKRLGHYSAGVLFSTILHTIVLAALVMHWEGRKEPERRIVPRYINATLLKMEPVAKPKPRVDNLAEKRKAEARRQAEEKRKAEEKRLAEVKRKKAEELNRKKAEELKRRKAEEARKKAEEERKLREAEQKKQRQYDLARALDAEDDFLTAETDAEVMQGYSNYIHDRVSSNWSRPPSARRGMEVELLIQLVPTGQLVGVTVVKSSGNQAFDRSAELAVRKVGRFERLKDMEPRIFEQNFRQFRLLFRPDDLRM